MRRHVLFAVLLLFGLSAVAQNTAKLTGEMQKQLAERTASDEQFRIIIGMADQYDQAKLSKQVETMKAEQRREFVINELSRFSSASQADLLKTLNEGAKANIVKNLNSFWIFNGVSCITTREMIYALSERKDIAYIASDEMRNMLPENNPKMKGYAKQCVSAETFQNNRDGSPTIAWNVTQVHANEVWNYTVGGNNIKGAGVVVAVIDTGLDYYHPDIITHLWQPTVNEISWGTGESAKTFVLNDAEHPNTFIVGGTTYKYPGYDFVNDDNNPVDDNGHGSHCAGTVAGNGASGIQTGMAPEAKIMALKVLSAAGSGSTDAITNAMQFALVAGAKVLSLSLGGHESWLGDLFNVDSNGPYRLAFNTVLAAGVVGVVAAGNEGEQYSYALNTTHYDVPKNIGSPGNSPAPWTHPDQTLKGGNSGVITIGASNRNDRKSTFSSFGPVSWKSSDLSHYFVNDFNDYDWADGDATKIGLIKPDVIVPGSDITSMYYKYMNPDCQVNGYANQNDSIYYAECGTSMATPGCAGIVALMLCANPDLTPRQVDSILELSALPVDFRTTKNNNTGAGRADAKAAVDAILTTATKPENFQVTNMTEGIVQNGGCVHLSWTPNTSAPAGYVIYRDNEPVGTIVSAQVSTVTVDGKITYKDEDPGVGLHTYYVRANDNNGYQSLHSNAVVCEVKPYATAKDLSITWVEGSSAALGTATLGWEPKIGSNVGQTEEATLHYTDVTHTAFTNSPLKTGYWGMRFTPEDLRPYLGMRIETISLYVYKNNSIGIDVTDNIHVRLYRGTLNGNTAETKVFDRICHVSNLSGWSEITLDLVSNTAGSSDNPGDINSNVAYKDGYLIDDITKDLWITFSDVITSDLLGLLQEYPIGVGEYDGPTSNCFYMGSTNTGVNGNNVVWSHIPDFGDAYNYAVSAVAHLSRKTTYNASYKVEFDNPSDEVSLATLQSSQTSGGLTDANRTLVSGENIYYVTAKAQEQTGNTLGTIYTSCPQEAKVVKVDDNYSVNSPYIDIDQTKVYLVQPTGKLTSDHITCADTTRLIIEDGGQLFTSSTDVMGTVKKEVKSYSSTGGGWNFIASPMAGNTLFKHVHNLISPNNNNAHLFRYDEPSHYWAVPTSTEHGSFTSLANGQGYLYDNANTVTLEFAGELKPSNNAVTLSDLSYTTTEGHRLPGWHLVGNPFPCKATIEQSYFTISGETLTAVAAGTAINPGQGVMVKVGAANTENDVTFTKCTESNVLPSQIAMNVARTELSRGDAEVEDNAIVSFNENSLLEKFVFNADNAKLYIPQGNKEYAIIASKLQGEVPVNFVAAENGSYTITVTPENVEFNYLHLIDNMTGADVDLLATPAYTFNASVMDYESRFRLLFSAGEESEDTVESSFAFFNGSEWVIANEGEATLQVVDMMGRVLSSEQVNGNAALSIDNAAGVYMLRLVNGKDVKVQKIIIK